MMATHYSSYQGILAWSGGEILLKHGQSIDEDHPLYRERPELFQGLAPGSDLQTNVGPGTVERATQAPGEVRQTPGTGPRTNRVPKTPESDQ